MNVYDSQRMAELLHPMGYAEQQSPDGADLIILNTCHIREKAEEKVFSDLGRMKRQKLAAEKQGKKVHIAVGGCVGQAAGEEIMKRAPYVDMVFGPQSFHKLPDMLRSAERSEKVVELDFEAVPKFDNLPEPEAPEAGAAFLSVQEGCDKFCTFCVVPYTRGAEFSRPVADILREAQVLVSKGAVEITLLGQNVNAYHGMAPSGKEWGLAALINELAAIDGLERIRYTTSHPRDMQQDLIDAHRDIEKLMPYLHLPIQAGSDAILKKMNRKHTASEYMDIIHRLREARPDLAMSSDFIVGFPGETDKDFEDTMRVVETVGYGSAYSFKYSPRPGTPAAEVEQQVEEAVKDERLQRLQALLNRQQKTFNEATIGRVFPVLLERPGKFAGQMIGRSPYLQSVHVRDVADLKGQLVEVKITAAHGNSLTGELTQRHIEAA